MPIFSCTGTTEKLAKCAADYLNADLYEIQPADPYTDEDLAYYTNGRADQEQNAPDARPQINGQVEDMSKYQIVVIAYPIWHGQAPRIISTFLGKATIFKIRQSFHSVPLIPAVLEASATDLEKLCADSAEWKEENDSIHRQQKVKLKTGLIALTSSRIIKTRETDEVGVFDFESKSVLLNSGYSMPINGLGTYSLLDDTCGRVKNSIKDGVRLIDTAYMYGMKRKSVRQFMSLWRN